MNTYEATIKLPSGGLDKVTVKASSWNHAKQMLELQFGAGRVMNLAQK